MKSFTLGRYTNHNTFVHKIDARIKIIFMIILMIGIFLNYASVGSAPKLDPSLPEYEGMLLEYQNSVNMAACTNFMILGIYFLFILTLCIIAKVNFFSIFKSLRSMWFIIVVIMLINLLIPSKPSWYEIAFSMGSLDIAWNTIFTTCYVIIRLVLVIMITTLVTTTTKPTELTFGIEWLLHPLIYIKVNVHVISMIILLTLRFIPSLLEESQRILRSQASRGVDFRSGKIKDKFKAIISLIIPLLMNSFMRSTEISDAMIARSYDPRGKRTKYRMLKWKYYDTLSLIFLLALFGLYVAQAALKVSWF